jgi:hypothetical protein
MSRFVNVPNGNYKITVQEGGTIYLDTGFDTGTVEISGNLLVKGETTTINTANMTIEDNIIVLNQGESGAGITDNDNSSGIEIDRGSLSNAFFVYDDSLNDPINSSTTGLFAFRLDGGSVRGIRTNHINTAGSNLHLINAGTGVITVIGTTNYENQVVDDDHITNKKYVDDAISTAFATVFLPQIGDGQVSISSITVVDEENSGVDSVINFAIDGVTVSQLFRDRWEFDEIRIAGTTIETLTSDTDLILKSSGTGNIRVDDVLHINSVPGDDDPSTSPSFPLDGAKIYTSNESTGKTGIYFANADQTRDELVSKNRALLFGMLF